MKESIEAFLELREKKEERSPEVRKGILEQYLIENPDILLKCGDYMQFSDYIKSEIAKNIKGIEDHGCRHMLLKVTNEALRARGCKADAREKIARFMYFTTKERGMFLEYLRDVAGLEKRFINDYLRSF